MKRYRTLLKGCDDTTIMDVELTDELFQFCTELAELSDEKSTCSCMPVMEIEEIKSDPDNGN